jgi:hypothetical protein
MVAGAVTLLYQDSSGGLEVLSHDGNWIPIPPNPSAYVVNIGSYFRSLEYPPRAAFGEVSGDLASASSLDMT